MRLPLSTVPCPHCGAGIQVRSFRPAPSRCPYCKKLTPHGFGCFVVGLMFALAFGLLAGGIVWLAGQFGQNLPDALVPLAALDGFGVASVWYWRSTPSARRYGPWTVFLLFAL